MKEFKLYKCEHCGNIALKVLDMGPNLSCCGDEMVELTANTVDAATEKHVPVVTREGNKIEVAVGSTLHPMEEKHWITVIIAVQEKKVQMVKLVPGDEPKACFEIEDGPVTVYEYCNLHGLWKTEA